MKSNLATGKTVLASSVFLGMALGTAHAETCYNLRPFADVIRVEKTTFLDEAPGAPIDSWSATGPLLVHIHFQ
jgi:hypothetical protein